MVRWETGRGVKGGREWRRRNGWEEGERGRGRWRVDMEEKGRDGI